MGVHSTAFWVQKCSQGSKVWSAVPALASWNDSRKQHPGKGWAIENRTCWPTRLPSQVGEPKVPLVSYKDFHQHNRHSYHDSDCCIVVVVSIIFHYCCFYCGCNDSSSLQEGNSFRSSTFSGHSRVQLILEEVHSKSPQY